jgi:hypothetical protein
MALIDLLVKIAAFVLVVGIAWLVSAYAPVPPHIRGVMNLVLGLMIVGILLWLVNTYIPMAGSIKAILNIVVVAASCVWVLQAFGLWDQAVRLWHHLITHGTPHERV